MIRDHHGRAARHRLDDGNAEPLEQRRVHERVGTPVERGQPLAGHVAGKNDAIVVEARLLAPPGAAGEDEQVLASEQSPRLDEACGSAAIRVDPHDPASIAAGVLQACTCRDELVRAGYEHAARFTWRATGESMLNGLVERRQ